MLQTALAILPLLPPGWLLVRQIDNPLPIVLGWIKFLLYKAHNDQDDDTTSSQRVIPPVGSQLLAYLIFSILGFICTNRLVPHIKVNEIVSVFDS